MFDGINLIRFFLTFAFLNGLFLFHISFNFFLKMTILGDGGCYLLSFLIKLLLIFITIA